MPDIIPDIMPGWMKQNNIYLKTITTNKYIEIL